MSRDAVESFHALADLPPAAAALFDGVGRETLFTSRPWYESFVAAALPVGVKPFFLALTAGGPARAVLPCLRMAGADPEVSSLTSFYSCDFRPLVDPRCDVAQTAFDLGGAVADLLRDEAAVRFDSLDSDLPFLEPFLAGLARPGRAVLRYTHFGRWWETLQGRSFGDYIAARDGALREVIRRKGAKLRRDGAEYIMLAAASDIGEIERGIADYETVYAASWKVAEPFPEFQPMLMRRLAAEGWLRLAICRLDGQPIAAQFWVVVERKATVLKLAHDRLFDKHSPGSLLTAFAIERLMEDDSITVIDFGRGDDSYKRGWTTNRTPHIGVLWVDIRRQPMRVARHWAGAALRRLRGGVA